MDNIAYDDQFHLAYLLPLDQEISSATKPTYGTGRNLGEMRTCDLFAQEELEQINNNARLMENFFHDCFRLESCNSAYRKFKQSLENVRGSNDDALREVEENLNSYISQFDMYKNHWEKYIKDTIKKHDPEKSRKMEKVFVDETHAAFDNNLGFALACCIRDFQTHGDILIDHPHVSTEGAEIFIQRDRLLNEWSWNTTKTKLIQSQPKEINLEMVATESHKEIMYIDAALIDAMIDDKIVYTCENLMEKYSRLIEQGYDARDWFVYKVTGHEMITAPKGMEGKPFVKDGKAEGFGIDYFHLNWQGYYATLMRGYELKNQAQ